MPTGLCARASLLALILALAACVSLASSASTYATLPSGTSPMGLTLDQSGNLYAVGLDNGHVYKISGQPATTVVYASFGALQPIAPAWFNGVLYVTTQQDSSIYSVASSGATPQLFAHGDSQSGIILNVPHGMAVDNAGLLYVADFGTSNIYKVTSSGGITLFTPAATLGSAGSDGLTIDPRSMYIFVSCYNNGIVYQLSLSDGSLVSTFAGFSGTPDMGISVDISLNIFLLEATTNAVIMYTAAGASYTTIASASDGLSYPDGSVMDPSGNLFIANRMANTVTLLPLVGTPVSGIVGDPQFSGFLGQSFQIHGTPGQSYDVVTTSNVQVNAKFVFLGEGDTTCPDFVKKDTLCWSHPGTYLGEVLVLAKTKKWRSSSAVSFTRVRVVSGSAGQGLKVYVDDQLLEVNATHMYNYRTGEYVAAEELQSLMAESSSSSLSASAGAYTTDPLTDKIDQSAGIRSTQLAHAATHWLIHLTDHRHVQVYTPHVKFTFINSDHFVNQEIQLRDASFLQQNDNDGTGEDDNGAAATADAPLLMHGLLGQTVRLRVYRGAHRFTEGRIDDYVVSDLEKSDDRYSLFNKATS